jgi:hypothetical protein
MKLYPLLNYTPRHKDVWGSGRIALHILTSALDGGEWPASCPGRFTTGERVPIPIGEEAGGPQSRSRRGGEEENSLHK